MPSTKLILPIILTLTVIRGLIYISLFPPWFAPDEPLHFEAIRLIGQEKLQPTMEVYQHTPIHPELIESFENLRVWQLGFKTLPSFPADSDSQSDLTFMQYYPAHWVNTVIMAGEYPLLYHNILAPISSLSQPLTLLLQVYILRLISLLFTVTTVLLGWFFAAAIFPSSIIPRMAVTTFLVFLPMHMHINTAVNTDVAATFLASLFFVLVARLLLHRYSRPYLLSGAIFLVAFLAGFVNPTTLFVIPTALVAGFVLISRRLRWPLRLTAIGVLLAIPLTLVGAVVVFQIANFGRGLATQQVSLSGLDFDVFVPGQHQVGLYIHTVRWGFLSFWGLFGWTNFHVPFGWIRVLWFLCMVMVAGFAWFMLRQVRGIDSRLDPLQQDVLLVLSAAVVFGLISMYAPIIATQSDRWGPPGRYFLPALLPLTLMLFIGFREWFPTCLDRWVLPVWVTIWVTFDTAVISLILIPAIYG